MSTAATLPSCANGSSVVLADSTIVLAVGYFSQLMMPARRSIDERDANRFLVMFTDWQIVDLFGMMEEEIAKVRRLGRNQNISPPQQPEA